MSSVLKDVYSAALALTELERNELTARLLEQDEPETWTQDGWESEIEQRVDEIRSGKATMVPWQEVREMLWNEINAQHL